MRRGEYAINFWMKTPVCANVTVSEDGWKRPREGSAALPPLFINNNSIHLLKLPFCSETEG